MDRIAIENALPESLGIPRERILNLIERLDKKQVPMHSLLIWRRGKLIAETYYAPYERHTLHRTFSISKSLTSIAIGLLSDEGKLSLDDPIVQYFPEYVPADVHPWIAEMTIRDMLMMRTCHESTTYKVNMKADWVKSFFTVPPTHPAGRFFHYDTSSAHTMAALAEKLSGKKMLDYIKEKLPELELSEGSYMIPDPFGVSMGGSGWVAEPMDLLKFGIFLYQKGNLCGRQALSREYLEQALSRQSSTLPTGPIPSESCGYGYQFWLSEKDTPVCYGMGGQFILLFPEQEMIVVTTADTQGIGGGNQLIYDALYEELLPYVVTKGTLASPPMDGLREGIFTDPRSTYADWKQMLSGLAIRPLLPEHDARITSPMAQRVDGLEYVFDDNPQGFSLMRFDWEKDENGMICAGIFSYTLHGKSCALHFGMGRMQTGVFPLYDQAYAGSGLWIMPDTLFLKFHIIDAYVGHVRMEFAFGDDDVTVFLKKQEESLFTEFNGHLYGRL